MTLVESSLPPVLLRNLSLLACPICDGSFVIGAISTLLCQHCNHSFFSDEGIPQLFWPNDWADPNQDVTDVVKEFYEENPFPNYDSLDSRRSLREKARKGVFAQLLDDQIGSARVLEVGCGTGQLSNFLGLTWGRTVFGVDLCMNSLRLANSFRRSEKIDGVAFLQMNLFKPVFRPNTIDIVICNGVLHHTGDPFGGFETIARLVRPGGYIIIGLYNSIGRIATYIRRAIFKVSGDRFKFLDSRLVDESIDAVRRHTWFMDQYKHPHESGHTIGEVQRWFRETGFEFVNSIPSAVAFRPFSEGEDLFKKQPEGSNLDHALVQLNLAIRGIREGGFFVMIGQKQTTASA